MNVFALLSFVFVLLLSTLHPTTQEKTESGIKYHENAKDWVPILEKVWGTGNTVRWAGIYNVKWATTPNTGADERDHDRLLAGFKNPNSFAETGVTIGGKKYSAVKADSNFVEGKSENGNGVYVFLTPKKTILIGLWESGMDAQKALDALKEADMSLRELEIAEEEAERTKTKV